jgi:hypothetical protein
MADELTQAGWILALGLREELNGTEPFNDEEGERAYVETFCATHGIALINRAAVGDGRAMVKLRRVVGLPARESEASVLLALGVEFFGEHIRQDVISPEMLTCIAETLAKLPRVAAVFAFERCLFMSIGGTVWGKCRPASLVRHPRTGSTRNMWLILLNEDMPREEWHSVIAHEIAHAWRKDDYSGITPEDEELQTDLLTRLWGFAGIGADVEGK